MLKIRYNTQTGLLSGWTDNEAQFAGLEARFGEGEEIALLDIAKPDADDYEYFIYQDGDLMPSGKTKPIPLEPLVFTPLNPVESVDKRLEAVEQFLLRAYPRQKG